VEIVAEMPVPVAKILTTRILDYPRLGLIDTLVFERVSDQRSINIAALVRAQLTVLTTHAARELLGAFTHKQYVRRLFHHLACADLKKFTGIVRSNNERKTRAR